MSEKRDQSRPAPESKGRPAKAPPGAPTAPAEEHREPPPETVECVQCRAQIPGDQAVMPEGLDYILYFCSPGCHEAWEKARGEGRSD